METGEETEEKPVSDKNPASTVESSSLGAEREVTAAQETVRSGHQLNPIMLAPINQGSRHQTGLDLSTSLCGFLVLFFWERCTYEARLSALDDYDFEQKTLCW